MNSSSPIRVLVVDDSATACQMLTTAIQADPALHVVATAANGQEAIEQVEKLKPDLITMDIEMPVMDGLEATKRIMAFHPTPILVVSSVLFSPKHTKVFRALEYGALDVMEKASSHFAKLPDKNGSELTERIKLLSRVHVIRHPLARLEGREVAVAAAPTAGGVAGGPIVAIASSTGGPQALHEVLKALPAALPCGVVVVQHISTGFESGLAQWLDSQCELTVMLAADGMVIKRGHVYIAPSGLHMGVTEDGHIRVFDGPPCEFQKPSGTLLFESVANVYGRSAVAVVLTGMGRDGADGLKEIRKHGGRVIAQDEASCVVFGMPKAAIELGVVDSVRPLDQISGAILAALGPLHKKGHSR